MTKHVAGLVAIAVGSCTCGAIACGDRGAEAPHGVSFEEVRPEMERAVDTASEFAERQRGALESRAQQLVDRVDDALARAREEAGEASEDVRKDILAAAERAERARDEVVREIELLALVTDATWEEAKRRLDEAMSELGEARREVTRALTEGEDAPPAA